jgi:RNA polymerase sigma factor (sigma-70 family)
VPKSKSSSASPPSSPAREPASDLETAYRTHGRWLLDFLNRRFGQQAAEDLAQETYARIARAGGGLRSPKAVLAITALNAARDQSRRRAVRPRLVGGDITSEAGVTPSDQVEAVLLKEVVFSLPHNLRVVFLLSRFGGLTYEEIAQQCGIAVKTVEGRINRARAICAARLRD